jgi:GNAT superfamily N-acetyltransferase
MRHTIDVERAGITDFDDVRHLLAALHEPPTGVADAPAIWLQMVADRQRSVLLARVNGAAAGTADVILVPNLTYDGSPWAIVENVVVHQRYRRMGVGRALIRQAEQIAEDAGCYKIQLASSLHRSAAHRFYDQMGFDRSAIGFRRYLYRRARAGAA